MPDIKLRDGSGVEQTYTGVDTITVPLADGSGTWTYGLTDEELNFSSGFYNFYSGRLNRFLKNEADRKRIKIHSGTDSYSGFAFTFAGSNSIEDLSGIELTFDDEENYQRNRFSEVFCDMYMLKELPTITNKDYSVNLYGNQSSSSFKNCYGLDENKIKKFIDKFYNTTIYQGCDFYAWCHSIRDGSNLTPDRLFNYKVTSQTNTNFFNGSFSLEKMVIPVFNKNYITTDNIFTSYGFIGESLPRVNSITFRKAEDGYPQKVSWKNQILDFTYNTKRLGFSTGSSYNQYWLAPYSTSGITKEKNIFYMNESYYNDSQYISNQNDLDSFKEIIDERYQLLKNDPDWFAMSNIQDRTTNKTYYIAQYYSRFNHDSVVELIDSLPDASEYLASAGGTNTIKFYGKNGLWTDGGAINTLTEEEIAVAAAKGWTVTFI